MEFRDLFFFLYNRTALVPDFFLISFSLLLRPKANEPRVPFLLRCSLLLPHACTFGLPSLVLFRSWKTRSAHVPRALLVVLSSHFLPSSAVPHSLPSLSRSLSLFSSLARQSANTLASPCARWFPPSFLNSKIPSVFHRSAFPFFCLSLPRLGHLILPAVEFLPMFSGNPIYVNDFVEASPSSSFFPPPFSEGKAKDVSSYF